ncbi:MAG TPA: hypothetical protein VKV73_17935, partial [Chloroflexota bacterium]|nr:hypothetical protein [Chloroflexota bacterium]
VRSQKVGRVRTRHLESGRSTWPNTGLPNGAEPRRLAILRLAHDREHYLARLEARLADRDPGPDALADPRVRHSPGPGQND